MSLFMDTPKLDEIADEIRPVVFRCLATSNPEGAWSVLMSYADPIAEAWHSDLLTAAHDAPATGALRIVEMPTAVTA